MIRGISHITFIVQDPARSAALFQTLLGAQEVYSSDAKNFSLSREKFLLAGGVWLCLMEGEPNTERTYNHLAFAVAEEELDAYIEKIRGLGLSTRPGRPRIEGEGRSVYFYDYDNHLFELHTGTLADRLEAYAQA